MTTTLDPWARQQVLARTTVVWAAGSIAVGAVLATRGDRWWRAFGQQHLGWGVVDLGIVAVVQALQRRTVARLPEPYAVDVLARRGRHLRRILVGNAVADAGYVVTGAVLWRRLHADPRAAGAGAAIVVQGAFLLVHDSYHAQALRRR